MSGHTYICTYKYHTYIHMYVYVWPIWMDHTQIPLIVTYPMGLHRFQWTGQLDQWSNFFFWYKAVKLTDKRVKGIELTSNLISVVVPLESFDAPVPLFVRPLWPPMMGMYCKDVHDHGLIYISSLILKQFYLIKYLNLYFRFIINLNFIFLAFYH